MKIEERIEGLLNEGNNPNTFIKGVNIQINKLENETEKLRKTFFNNLKKLFSGVPDKETFEFIIKNPFCSLATDPFCKPVVHSRIICFLSAGLRSHQHSSSFFPPVFPP